MLQFDILNRFQNVVFRCCIEETSARRHVYGSVIKFRNKYWKIYFSVPFHNKLGYKTGIIGRLCDRLHAYSLIQSWFLIMLCTLIARVGGFQTHCRSRTRDWCPMACLWSGPPCFNLSFSLTQDIGIILAHHSDSNLIDTFSVMIHWLSLRTTMQAQQCI